MQKKVEEKVDFKIETIEEFIARGGKVTKGNFSKAYGTITNYGRDTKGYAKHLENKKFDKNDEQLKII